MRRLLFAALLPSLGLRAWGGVPISMEAAFHAVGILVVGIVPGAWAATLGATVHAASAQWSPRPVEERAALPLARVARVVLSGGLPAMLLPWLAGVLGVPPVGGADGPDSLLALAAVLALCYALLRRGAWHAAVHAASPDPADKGVRLSQALLVETPVVPVAAVLAAVTLESAGTVTALRLVLAGGVLAAGQMALLALERSRRATVSRLRDLEFLLEVGRAVEASFDLGECCQRVERAIAGMVPSVDAVTIALRDAEAVRFWVWPDIDGPPREGTVPELLGPHGWVVGHGSTLLLQDAAVESAALGEALELGARPARAWMGAPVRLDDEALGLVSAQSLEAGVFRAEHVRLLDALARQVAAGVANARLVRLATEDGLTGLFVRRYFEGRLNEEWVRHERWKMPFSVLTMDLDGLKRVNDELGHAAGDRLLTAVGRAIRTAVREVDVPARMGGDEMAVLLTGAEPAEASRVAERIRAVVSATPVSTNGQSLTARASFGVVFHPSSGARSPAELLELADRALYKAKAAGGDRVEVAAESIPEEPAA